ncbi:hypothetical protein PP707_07760, partial [Acetobacter pasteurianus]|nr:hypothetical protein [Acetobacter pasteurianus]
MQFKNLLVFIVAALSTTEATKKVTKPPSVPGKGDYYDFARNFALAPVGHNCYGQEVPFDIQLSAGIYEGLEKRTVKSSEKSSAKSAPAAHFQVTKAEKVDEKHYKIAFLFKTTYDPSALKSFAGESSIEIDFVNLGSPYMDNVKAHGDTATFKYNNPFDFEASVIVSPIQHGNYFCLPPDFGIEYRVLVWYSDWLHVF